MTQDSTLIERAMRLSARAHLTQTRKESNLPYLMHPSMVALMLARHGFASEVLAAALVHDVLEDTEVGEIEMGEELGQEVVALVKAVSYDPALSWEDARVAYIESVRQAPEGAKAISVADKIHNAQSLILGHQREGKSMWSNFTRPRDKKLWFEEEMLKMLRESWQHPLVDEYAVLVEELKALEY